jgi:signal recognition particle subunit SRP54
MFDRLSSRLEEVLKRLRSRGTLTEADIDVSLKEVRLALLEADVHFKVVKTFLEKVRQKAVGAKVLESLTPGQQVIKVVWGELRDLMGGDVPDNRPLPLSANPPTLVMLVGLQGAGKTTTAAKLARRFKDEGRRVLLVAADIKRPAAVEQLVALGEKVEAEVFTPARAEGDGSPRSVCREAARRGRDGGFDLVIFDTAGRLHIDEDLMAELAAIQAEIRPHEILLTVDAMTGQDAVQIGSRFMESVGLTGAILTKLDGDARGGAMLSIRQVTGLPVRFLGVGEKLDGLEPFHPDRMASRILGMGDVLTLIERAEEAFDGEKIRKRESEWRKKGLTLEDFREQIRGLKKMGSVDQVLGMIPGAGRLREAVQNGPGAEGKSLVRIEAIMDSMTVQERRNPSILNGSRRKRIARGSGTSVQEVNRLLKQFLQMKKLAKSLSNHQGKRGLAQLLGSF